MSKYKYELISGKLYVINCDISLEILNIKNEMPEFTGYYRTLLAHKRDMEYANEYLKQMFFQKGTTLIDGALINSAIQLLIRCFSKPKNNSRGCLDSNKVFNTYAISQGKVDMTKQFAQYYSARNQIIAHDQCDYKENIIGLSIDQANGKCVDVTSLTIRTMYMYQQNKDILLKLIDLVYSYVGHQLEMVELKMIEKYNSMDVKPSLSEIETNIPAATSW